MLLNTLAVPEYIHDLLTAYRTCELTTFTKTGMLSVVPVVAVWDDEAASIVFATAVAYPQKAYNIRRNPHLSLLFSDPVGAHLEHESPVLVQGIGKITEDLEAKRLTTLGPKFVQKIPDQNYHLSPLMKRLMDWYYVRLMIDVFPERIINWRAGDYHQLPDILGETISSQLQEIPQKHMQPLWKPEWAKIIAKYPTAAVSCAFGSDYPFSYRSAVKIADNRNICLLDPLADGFPAAQKYIQYPAALLFHAFSESMKMDAMSQFQLQGYITVTDNGVEFTPVGCVPGLGSRRFDKPQGMEQFTAFPAMVRSGKRKTKEYLQKRTFQSKGTNHES